MIADNLRFTVLNGRFFLQIGPVDYILTEHIFSSHEYFHGYSIIRVDQNETLLRPRENYDFFAREISPKPKPLTTVTGPVAEFDAEGGNLRLQQRIGLLDAEDLMPL